MEKVVRPGNFQVGQLVLLNWAAAGKVGDPLGKLRPQWLGPFRVLEGVFGNAYRLDLPAHMRIHPVVNIRFIKPYVVPFSETDKPLVLNPVKVHEIAVFRVVADADDFYRLEFQVSAAHVDATTIGWLTTLQVAQIGGFFLMVDFLSKAKDLKRISNHKLGTRVVDVSFSPGRSYVGIVSSFDPLDRRSQYELVYEDADSRWVSGPELGLLCKGRAVDAQ